MTPAAPRPALRHRLAPRPPTVRHRLAPAARQAAPSPPAGGPHRTASHLEYRP